MRETLVGLIEFSTIIHKHSPAFVVGSGIEKQDRCRTNKIGPTIYQQCATQTLYTHKGERYWWTWPLLKNLPGEEPKTYKLAPTQCITLPSPAMGSNEPCFYFHKGPKTRSYVSSAWIGIKFYRQVAVSESWYWRGCLDAKGKRQEICHNLHS